MDFEENLVRMCVSRMKECLDRMEKLKNTKVDDNYKNEVIESVAIEIKNIMDEYNKVFSILYDYLNASKVGAYNGVSVQDIKDIIWQDNKEYNDIIRYYQKRGYIDKDGIITAEGTWMIGKGLLNNEEKNDIMNIFKLKHNIVNDIIVTNENTRNNTSIDETHDDNIKLYMNLYSQSILKRKSDEDKVINKDEIDNFVTVYQMLKDKKYDDVSSIIKLNDILSSSQVDNFINYYQLLKKYKDYANNTAYNINENIKLTTDVPIAKNTINNITYETNDIIENMDTINDKDKNRLELLCPTCLQKVKLQNYCELCGQRLIYDEKSINKKILNKPIVENNDPVSIKKPYEQIDVRKINPKITYTKINDNNNPSKNNGTDLDLKKNNQVLNLINPINGQTILFKPLEYINQQFLNDFSFIYSLVVGFILIFSSILLNVFKFNIPFAVGGSDVLKNAYILICDTIPGIPLSFNLLDSSSFGTIIFVGGIIGVNLIVVGAGMWKKSNKFKLSGTLIFSLASIFNVYNYFIGASGFVSIYGLILDLIFLYVFVRRM